MIFSQMDGFSVFHHRFPHVFPRNLHFSATKRFAAASRLRQPLRKSAARQELFQESHLCPAGTPGAIHK